MKCFPKQSENKADVEKAVCDICLEPKSYIGNEIVFCDWCFVAVHQNCYGGSIGKEILLKEWICERCSQLRSTGMASGVICRFCPEKKGAMMVDSNRNAAHLLCCKWIRDFSFSDFEFGAK